MLSHRYNMNALAVLALFASLTVRADAQVYVTDWDLNGTYSGWYVLQGSASPFSMTIADENFTTGTFDGFMTSQNSSITYGSISGDSFSFSLDNGQQWHGTVGLNDTLSGGLSAYYWNGPWGPTNESAKMIYTPEPGAYALLGSLGLTGGVLLRRRRQR